MKKTAIAVALAFAGFGTSAYAVQDSNTWYNSVKFGISKFKNVEISGNGYIPNNGATIPNSFGEGVSVGYQQNKFLSFEVGYDLTGKIIREGDNVNGNILIEGLHFTTKLSYPISTRLDAYARVGTYVAFIQSKQYNKKDNKKNIFDRDTDSSPLLGLGVEYSINKDWSSRIECEWINNVGELYTVGVRPDNTFMTFSIVHKFNQKDKDIPNVNPNVIKPNVNPNIVQPNVNPNIVKPNVNPNIVKPHPLIHNKIHKKKIKVTLKFIKLFPNNKIFLIKNGKNALKHIYHQISNLTHKDTVYIDIMFGTKGYNQEMAKKRALTIINYLISLGVPANKIHDVNINKFSKITKNCNKKSHGCLVYTNTAEIQIQGLK